MMKVTEMNSTPFQATNQRRRAEAMALTPSPATMGRLQAVSMRSRSRCVDVASSHACFGLGLIVGLVDVCVGTRSSNRRFHGLPVR